MHGSRSAAFEDASRRQPPLQSFQSRRYWDDVFAGEDHIHDDESDYLRWKTELTLNFLLESSVRRALEIGCGEGHLTAHLAQRVDSLTAIDFSPQAIARARQKCSGRRGVRFAVMDLANDALPRDMDLIVCSEVLYYLPLHLVRLVARQIFSSLQPGGDLLLAHANMAVDDADATGFDIGAPFGAKTIGDVFAAAEGADLVRRLRTPLFTLDLFRRAASSENMPNPVAEHHVDLPPSLRLWALEQQSVLWRGKRHASSAVERSDDPAKSIAILMYHSIADDGPAALAPYRMSVARFADQMAYLKREKFSTITLAEWLSYLDGTPLPHERPIILTFDDGYSDFFDNAWPVLERNGLSATVFVVTRKVGQAADWDDHGEAPVPLMSWDQLRTLAAAGVEIGGHSTLHWDLSTVSMQEVGQDGERARKDLQRELGLDIPIMAYPWGRGGADVGRALADAGYSAAVTTYGGRSRPGDDKMNLPRIEVFGHDGLSTFAAKVAGCAEVAETDGVDDEAEHQPGQADVEWLEGDSGAPELWSFDDDASVTSFTEVVSFDEDPWLRMADPVPPDRSADPSGNVDLEAPNPPVCTLAMSLASPAADARPDGLSRLSARLDRLIGECLQLQSDLSRGPGSASTLQQKITRAFNRPCTGQIVRAVVSPTTLAPEIFLDFDEGVDAWLTVEPKSDHAASPDSFLNALTLDIRAPSSLLALVVTLEWADLGQADAYQLNLHARAERPAAGFAELMFPCRDGSRRQFGLKPFTVGAASGAVVSTGDFRLPDYMDIDETAKPELRLCFDASAPLKVTIDYMNVYFA